LLLLRVEEPLARHFYIKQCQIERWSFRELQRQINSMLFERIALSKDKKGVLEMAKKGHQIFKPEDLLKDPYVFEFLNLSEDQKLSESDLEQKLINHLKQFLFELGQGFCFVAQQKRITIDADHNYIDLVFYHRILKCFVLIDLKMRAFKPSDGGQMNFYINYIKDNENAPEDNPPIGILLCLDRNELYVKYATAGMANLILTGRFKLSLPSPEMLKAEVQKVLEG
jgi:predicted nuclease of restriction endonuclease-like (RecB) superfamily